MEDKLAVYQSEDGKIRLDVSVKGESVWLTQAQMAMLFERNQDTIGIHIQNIYTEGELNRESTTEEYSVVQTEGNRNVSRVVKHYSLDMIISVGYRVSSKVATQFRQWATQVLKSFITQGFALDEQRLKQPSQAEHFEQLLKKIRVIRTSEMEMYAKVRDVFKETSTDYAVNSKHAQEFFATSQNKFHYAITQRTAAEIIKDRCDHQKANVGMLCTEYPTKNNVAVAKNYLDTEELNGLMNICDQFILFAESKAMRKQPMTMEKWITKLNQLIEMNEYPVLYGKGSISHEDAKNYAIGELQKYKAIQCEERRALPE